MRRLVRGRQRLEAAAAAERARLERRRRLGRRDALHPVPDRDDRERELDEGCKVGKGGGKGEGVSHSRAFLLFL
jgi:hypothetical protein